jgi:hypothetical protein
VQLEHESAASPDAGVAEGRAVHKKQAHFCWQVHVPDSAECKPGSFNIALGFRCGFWDVSFEVEKGRDCSGLVGFVEMASWVSPAIGGKDDEALSPTAG